MEINNYQFARMQELEDIRIHNELYPSPEPKYQKPKQSDWDWHREMESKLDNIELYETNR